MYKILISGYYGFNNIGDESILRAVVSGLKEKLDDVDITVLSANPSDTAKRFGVKTADRKSFPAILKELSRCDLLISGGGSLLQDVTSKKSILYYLCIMRLARFLGKDFIVYSQGVGPINSRFNRKATVKVLKKSSGIVVRDVQSKEFLTEIGIDPSDVIVTADPVLRLKKVDLERGKRILLDEENFKYVKGDDVIGFAIKSRKTDSPFVDELVKAMKNILDAGGNEIVLIPFHFSEDMAVAAEIQKRLEEAGYVDKVCTVRHKYLSDEMMSIIGNMDMLVGVRLHSLIQAAIMGVPMIGISYDPKVNSFMNSIGLKAMCSVYDFNSEFFAEELQKTVEKKDEIRGKVAERLKQQIASLDKNEELIRKLMQGEKSD